MACGAAGDVTIGGARLLLGDCLERMGEVADGSVDLILADLPYGTTACKWDTIIPFEPLWAHYRRILKPRGAVVLTASQPFTSMLVMSNRKWFRYSLVWDQRCPTGHLNAKKMPLRVHQDIAVFSPSTLGRGTYRPIMRAGAHRVKGSGGRTSECYGSYKNLAVSSDAYYPTSIVVAANGNWAGKVHPTQKPVALGSYLIRTYSNPRDAVLDNTMGSGSFGVSAVEEGRSFIGIERDPGYFAIAERRLAGAVAP
jgi:site-specific DNA-methyltransferase (adenine-specific)